MKFLRMILWEVVSVLVIVIFNLDTCTNEVLLDIVDFDILPMLNEYWFDEPSKVERWENNLHGVFE